MARCKTCQGINKTRTESFTAAKYAALCNNLDRLKLLIEYDASILKKEKLQLPVLSKRMNVKDVRLLLRYDKR